MSRPVLAIASFITANAMCDGYRSLDGASPAPTASVPPGDRSETAAGASSQASADFSGEMNVARLVLTSSEPPRVDQAKDGRRFLPVEESNPDDLCMDAVRREMAKP